MRMVMVPLGLSKSPIPASLPSPPLYASLLGKHKRDTKRALLSSRTEPSIRHYYVLSESGSAELQPYVSISWREHLRNERYRLITYSVFPSSNVTGYLLKFIYFCSVQKAWFLNFTISCGGMLVEAVLFSRIGVSDVGAFPRYLREASL